MKRKTAMVLLAVMCFGCGASAADVTVIDGKQQVELVDVLELKDSAILMVMKSGVKLNEDELVTIRTAMPDENGKTTWNFGMPEKIDGVLTDGEYDSYIKQNGVSFKTDSFVYASVESRNRVEDALGSVSAGDDLALILDNSENLYALRVFGFNMDGYLESKNKSAIIENTVKNIESKELAAIAKVFNLALAVDAINSGADAKSYLEAVNPVFEETAFNDIEDEKLSAWIIDIIGDNKYASPEELADMYEAANILYIINNSRVNYMQENLEKYAEALGIESDSDYKDYLDSSKKESINKKIVKALSSNPAKDADDLTDIIGDALDDTSKSTSSSGSGGGGGGSSSRPSGVAVTVPSDSEPKQKEEKNAFSDMSSAKWAEIAVNAMAKSGVVAGDENGNFRPNDTVTREEFVKMLVLATGNYDASAECAFSDTKVSDWHYRYIASAFNKELVKGVSETEFGTGALLTRQDMALLCRRASGGLEAKREKKVFADDSDIADYAKEAVYELYMAEGISGMGDDAFSPLTPATRAQAATIIYNLFLK